MQIHLDHGDLRRQRTSNVCAASGMPRWCVDAKQRASEYRQSQGERQFQAFDR